MRRLLSSPRVSGLAHTTRQAGPLLCAGTERRARGQRAQLDAGLPSIKAPWAVEFWMQVQGANAGERQNYLLNFGGNAITGTEPAGIVGTTAYDARDRPEFTLDVTLTPPANGSDYQGSEAPVVSVVHERVPPDEIALALERRAGIAVRTGLHCSPWAHQTVGTIETGAVRFGIGYGLTGEDVDVALEAMRDICR